MILLRLTGNGRRSPPSGLRPPAPELFIGLDVHNDSIALSIALGDSTEVRRYGIIGGTLDAVDKVIRRLSQPDVELRVVCEAGPCGSVICRHLRSKGIHCDPLEPTHG